MIEINGKNYEVHKVKFTKKDLKKGETLIFISEEAKQAITVSLEDKE